MGKGFSRKIFQQKERRKRKKAKFFSRKFRNEEHPPRSKKVKIQFLGRVGKQQSRYIFEIADIPANIVGLES